jgi:hypothetical protein
MVEWILLPFMTVREGFHGRRPLSRSLVVRCTAETKVCFSNCARMMERSMTAIRGAMVAEASRADVVVAKATCPR